MSYIGCCVRGIFAVYFILNKVGGPEKLLFIKVLSSIIFRKTSAQNI